MNPNKLIVFTLVFIGCFSISFAQKKQPIIQILNQLEKKFNVKFSYAISDVENIQIITPAKKDNLKEVIKALNSVSSLQFSFLDKRYITVTKQIKKINICGVLKSSSDYDLLFGATILIINSTKGTTTNEKGVFELSNINPNSILKIEYLGYKSLTIEAKTLQKSIDNCKIVLLEPQSELLNQVLITKFLTTGIQKSTDGSTILNTKKFGILPGLTEPDILQSIQTLPGVESINESIANINVRGGTNDQNLILWDGIKMYHSGHFFGLISAYNPYLTDKVVVSKNGTSSEFSDGVSSTINVATKNKVVKQFSGGVGANLLHTDAFFEIPITKNISAQISGRRSFTDFFTSTTYDNYFERSFQDSELTTNQKNISDSSRDSEFFFYDYSAKLLFDFNENQKFRISTIGINNRLDYTERFTNRINEVESKTSNLTQENLGLSANWKAKWNPVFSTNITTFYSKYSVDAVDFRVENNQQLTQANEVLENGLKLKTNFRIHENLNLLSGYQFSELGILNATTVNNPAFETTQKGVLLSHALFSELEFKHKKTYLRAGLRANYFKKFQKTIIEPRLVLKQNLSKTLALKLKGEFKNQTASQIIDFQDDFLGVENRRWILANEEDIPISESKQASFGTTYTKNNWVIDVEGFYKNVDGITVANQGFFNNFQFLEATGSYQAKGLECIINKTAKKYSTWLSYTYSINNYTFNTLTPSVFPNNVDMRHSISVACNYDILKNLKVSIGGMWRTGQPFTKAQNNNETIVQGNNIFVNYDFPNNENLDDFIRVDFSMNYKFQFSKKIQSSLRVGIINLLNRENTISKYYEVNPNDTTTAIEIKNNSLGLTPNVNFRMDF